MLSLKPLANQAQKGKGPLSQVENHARPMTKTVINHHVASTNKGGEAVINRDIK